jgi:superoxide dismutase, Fe-Mn family
MTDHKNMKRDLDISRRDLLATAALTTSTIVFGHSALSQTSSRTGAKYQVKPLAFDPSKLKGISEKLIVSHHDKNYAGAVKRLSAIEQKISELPKDAAPFQMGSLKRESLIAMNSMILHEYYFDNLGGDGVLEGAIKETIARDFNSFEAWQHDFRLTGQSLAGGSGWVILAYSPRDKCLFNVWSSDHTVSLAAGVPLLVMDMYEHAYQMDYGADASAYIAAFFANINWEQVNKRAENLKLG